MRYWWLVEGNFFRWRDEIKKNLVRRGRRGWVKKKRGKVRKKEEKGIRGCEVDGVGWIWVCLESMR